MILIIWLNLSTFKDFIVAKELFLIREYGCHDKSIPINRI